MIDSEFAKYVPDQLSNKHVTASQIVRLLIRKQSETSVADAGVAGPSVEEAAHTALLLSDDLRMTVCRDMIGNTICADLLDYLHRDWYHVGKPRSFDERILQYLEIRPKPNGSGLSRKPRNTDRFVVSLGKRPKIRTDAVSAILELLEWRYQLAESVLFHRTKLAAAAMLDRALFELWGEVAPPDLESILLPLSDEEMIQKCIELAGQQKEPRHRIAEKILRALDRRELYGHLSTRFYDEVPGDLRPRVQKKFGKSDGFPNLAPSERAKVLRVLEADFQLPEGSVVMYCPTAGMNAKIAEVQIAVGDEVAKFSDYERGHGEQLAGGHLEAQQRRFHRLWRVHFFIDRTAKDERSTILPILHQTIEKLVLGNLSDDSDYVQVARSLAVLLTQTEGSPWKGKSVSDEAVMAAYRNPTAATGVYPFAQLSIRSLIKA